MINITGINQSQSFFDFVPGTPMFPWPTSRSTKSGARPSRTAYDARREAKEDLPESTCPAIRTLCWVLGVGC